MPHKLRTCREPTCRARFNEGARWADFCSQKCRRRWQNRALKRGSQLYRVAMKWRGFKRSHTKGAKNPPNPHFGEMCHMLDLWRQEDAEMRKAAQGGVSPTLETAP